MIVLQLLLYCLLFIAMVKIAVIGGAVNGLHFYPEVMAAGDWLLGCIPLQATDAGMFNRAYYLSGSYGLWSPALIAGIVTML